jgi:hypothetical protein
MRSVSETPENWVILKITNNGETVYKVFGSWAGGYLGSDNWRINSGIKSVEEEGDYFYFYGYSGSCYKCHKNLYGVLTSYNNGVLDALIKTGYDNGAEIEIMDKETNWLEL